MFAHEMEQNSNIKNKNKARQLEKKLAGLFGNNRRIALIIADDDHLSLDEIKKDPELKDLHYQHERLSRNLMADLKAPINLLDIDLQEISYQSLNNYFENRLIEIIRIRMALSPEFQKSIQTHTVTGHKYLVLKALWMDDQMKKKVICSISLGNVEHVGFEIDSNKPEIIIAKKELQDKLIFIYKDSYPQR
jgi:hypothetical protein